MHFDRGMWDKRHDDMCAHCGEGLDTRHTRDHAPSRVLLDDPFPPDIPNVPSCRPCNESFSRDEEYLACIVECAIVGTTDPDRVSREKVARILRKNVDLATSLSQARTEKDGRVAFAMETHRVRNVVLKLARAHARFELSESQLEDPSGLVVMTLPLLTEGAREAFEAPPPAQIFPEVGSRAMQRLVVSSTGSSLRDWVVVQPARYRYLVVYDSGVTVKLVLSEFLGCEVTWE